MIVLMQSPQNHEILEIPLLFATAMELCVPQGPSLYGDRVKPDISDLSLMLDSFL